MDHRHMYVLARRVEGITHDIGYSQTSFYADTEISNGEWQWEHTFKFQIWVGYGVFGRTTFGGEVLLFPDFT